MISSLGRTIQTDKSCRSRRQPEGWGRLESLPRDWQRLVGRKWALGDSIGEGWPFDELHHERLHAIAIFESVDCRDVRVIERCEDFRLALETVESAGIRRDV